MHYITWSKTLQYKYNKINTRRVSFVYLRPANCTCAIFLNSGISTVCSYIVKAVQTEVRPISWRLILPLINYSKWPLLPRIACNSRSTIEDSDFPFFSNMKIFILTLHFCRQRNERQIELLDVLLWIVFGYRDGWSGVGGVKLLFRLQVEPGIVEYQWFPWGFPPF